MTTHVALVRHHQTGLIEPASYNGVVIVGSPVQLRSQFGVRVLAICPKEAHAFERLTISFESWGEMAR